MKLAHSALAEEYPKKKEKKFWGPLLLSYAEEELSYIVMPPRKLSKAAISLLRERVGKWIIKRNDIHDSFKVVSKEQWADCVQWLTRAYIST